jgi:electron transfer flavoprotein alpha/beta subunit
MKITVCIKEVVDSTLNTGFGYVSRALMQKGLPRRLDKYDTGAMSMALSLKDHNPDTEITVISIGPRKIEGYLRDMVAIGANKTIRIEEGETEKFSPYLKALLLSKAISLSGADLILCGARSMDNGSGQVGPLTAAMLGLPCICRVVDFHPEEGKNSITVTRNVSKDTREKLICRLPAVLAVELQEKKLPYASLDKLLESLDTEIKHLAVSDLGIYNEALESDAIQINGLSFPRPRPKKVTIPTSTLPAFDRILALLQGGIANRRGEILKGDTDELADRLFEILIEKEVIRPAPPDNKRVN